MLRASTEPRASKAAWPSSKISAPARSRLSVRKSRNCGKKLSSRQAGQRDVAEDADLAVLLGQAAHDLHAAEQQQVVDGGDQAARARRRSGIRPASSPGRSRRAGARSSRRRLVAPLRQADDRLQVEVDAVLGQGLAHGLQQGRRPGGRGRRRCGAGKAGASPLLVQPRAACAATRPSSMWTSSIRPRRERWASSATVSTTSLSRASSASTWPSRILWASRTALDLAADRAGLQRALDQAVEGEAEAEAADQGRHARAPAAAVAPQRQRDDQRQAEIGRAEKPEGEPSHGPAIRIDAKYPPGSSRGVEWINAAGNKRCRKAATAASAAGRAGAGRAATGRPRRWRRGRRRTGCG